MIDNGQAGRQINEKEDETEDNPRRIPSFSDRDTSLFKKSSKNNLENLVMGDPDGLDEEFYMPDQFQDQKD